ncbi:hypothetical protein HRE53_32995 (plasmid) [Acaryochloris sp. 'Moss Beach']|uniref:hypothetical protein n=1 Tax=Acaryochloris sp. 'Moss Beach' TaxID=2740837 RepID=UPI001F237564|nr:hypothetical protein [Acaryochloris sp. 'Moss Beach']UJB73371.1 hypothetical protein HRE53_32995 [Acaryochloris sp. 'Moss Beach']
MSKLIRLLLFLNQALKIYKKKKDIIRVENVLKKSRKVQKIEQVNSKDYDGRSGLSSANSCLNQTAK